MNLITTFHNTTVNERFNEVKNVALCNILNPLFKKIYIFFDNLDSKNKNYDFLNHNKVVIINVNSRQMYSQMINFANNNLKGEYIVISNTDILFDKTINRISEIDFHDKKLIALTRWNLIQDNSKIFKLELQYRKTVAWSYDTYIFQSPIEVDLDTIQIQVGIPGCDNLLVKRLEIDNNFIIENPCIDIRTYHIDKNSRERNLSFDYYSQYDYIEAKGKKATTIDNHFEEFSNDLKICFDYKSILNNISNQSFSI